MITPSDIQNKEFSRAKRGYDCDEVDEFLDLITEDMQRVLLENKKLREELSKAGTKVQQIQTQAKQIQAQAQAKVEEAQASIAMSNAQPVSQVAQTTDAATESSVYETLAAAKQLMNDIAASAERRAEIILKNAELQADLITREAKENISRYTEEGNRLMGRVELLRERYTTMLKDELGRYESVDNDFFAEFADDFIPASLSQVEDKTVVAGGYADSQTSEVSEKDYTKTVVLDKNQFRNR